jgi:hypothetical protein
MGLYVPIEQVNRGLVPLFFRLPFAFFLTLLTHDNSVPERLLNIRLSSSQIEAIKQKSEHFCGVQAEACLSGWRVDDTK